MKGRIYYRNRLSGDRGYVVQLGGAEFIQLDDASMTRMPKTAEWEPAREERTLTEHQIAQVAFEADKRLCFYLGRHDVSRKQWADLEQTVRASWMSGKRTFEDAHRGVLYACIFEALKDLSA